jgi:hypothetical protein
MFAISLRHFISTGCLGAIRLGDSHEDVIGALGCSPQDLHIDDVFDEEHTGFRIGCLGVSFFKQELNCISIFFHPPFPVVSDRVTVDTENDTWSELSPIATCDLLSDIDHRLKPNITCLQGAKRSAYGIWASEMTMLLFERQDDEYELEAISATHREPCEKEQN